MCLNMALKKREDSVTVSRISQHDQRLQAVEDRADAQAETLRTLQVLVQELINKNKTGEKSFASLFQQQPQTLNQMPTGESYENRSNQTTDQVDSMVRLVKIPPDTVKQTKSFSNIQNQLLTSSQSPRPPQPSRTDSEGFSFQHQQIRRQRRAAIIGKRKSSAIKSGSKHIDLFVSRVHNDVDDSDLEKFITDEGIDAVAMERVSHEDARMKSFKVTIRSADKDKTLKDEFWPEGIMCRQFFGRRDISSK